MKDLGYIHIISRAIAENKDLRPEVDDLFHEYRDKLKDIPLTLPELDNRLYHECDLRTEIYGRKLAALHLISSDRAWFRAPELEAKLEELTKRVYPQIWRYVSSNTRLTRHGIRDAAITGDSKELLTFGVLIYIAKYIKEAALPMEDEAFRSVYERFAQMTVESNILDTPKPSTIVDKIAKDVVNLTGEVFGGSYPHDVEMWRQSDFYEGDGRQQALEALLDRIGMPIYTVNRVKTSRKLLEDAVRMYLLHSGALRRTIEDLADVTEDSVDWFVSVLPTIAYASLYKEARDIAIEYSDHFAEDEEHKATKVRLAYMEEQAQQERDRNKKLQEQLNEMQKENDRLQLRIADMKTVMDELAEEVTLLEDAARQSLEMEEPAADPCDLRQYRVVIAGGHDTWQHKIKEAYPHVTLINGEHFDQAVVENADIIVFNWLIARHSLYYKLINLARSQNKKIVYIGNNNLEFFKKALNCR